MSSTNTSPTASTGGLRERKKAAAMRRIQNAALELFRAHGFDRVRIEQVADAAEVSPSTVYRYFGTKEGLVLHDEFDDQILREMRSLLDQGDDPWQAMGKAFAGIAEEHFTLLETESLERFQLWMKTPSIQAAAYLVVDQTVDELARTISSTGRWNFGEARVIASSMLWPLLAALRNWFDDNGARPWLDYVFEGLRALGQDEAADAIQSALDAH